MYSQYDLCVKWWCNICILLVNRNTALHVPFTCLQIQCLLCIYPVFSFYVILIFSFRPRKGRGLKKSEEKSDSRDTEQQGPWQFEESQRLYRNKERRVQSLISVDSL